MIIGLKYLFCEEKLKSLMVFQFRENMIEVWSIFHGVNLWVINSEQTKENLFHQ